ncbi:MAG: PHB depolymerase family esterase [Gemmataceae bacterium]
MALLQQAYINVQENARELGIDPSAIESIEAEGAEAILKQLSDDLQARTYHPSQEAEREGRIMVRDLVVQAASNLLLESAFPPVFPRDPEAEKTIKWLAGNIDKGLSRAYVVNLNESLDDGGQERLMERAGRRIGDPQLNGLLEEILTASQSSQGLLTPLLADIAFEEIDHIFQQAKVLGREGNFLHVQCTRVGNELVVLADRDPRYDWILPAVQKRLREELPSLHYDAAAVETQSLDLICGEPLNVLGFELRWVQRRGGEARTLYRLVKRDNRRQAENAPSSGRLRGRYHPFRFAQSGLAGMKRLLRWQLIRDAYANVNSIQVSWRHLPITLYPIVALLSGWSSLAAWLCMTLIFLCNWQTLPGLVRSLGSWVKRRSLEVALGAWALAAVICIVPEISGLWANRPQEVEAPPYMPAGFYKGQFHGDSWWSSEPTTGVSYGLYVPPHLQDRDAPFPLIVFLHGFEGRTEARLFRRNILTALAKRFGGTDDANARFNFVAFAPIDPSGRWLPDSTEVRNVLLALDYVMRRHRIDPSRVYLTGIAKGGDGVWRLAEAYPDRWAALVPIHSSYPPYVQKVQYLPAWIFDAPQDGASVTQQKTLLTELQKTKADVRYTETSKKSEAVWTEVYQSQTLYDWLAKKKKG